jgi:hypothetical protein
MGPIACAETSVRNHHFALRKTKQKAQIQICGTYKSSPCFWRAESEDKFK